MRKQSFCLSSNTVLSERHRSAHCWPHQKQLEQGCVILLARRPKNNGSGKEVVGYAIYQQGVFSVFGHLRKISSDFLFTHYGEVLPEYRGQRIQQMSIRARIRYCRSNGIKKCCSSVGIYNRPSIIGRRGGSTITGTIEQVSVFGGLFKWETPWEKIEAALRRGEP